MAHKYYMACVINDQENAKEAAIRMKDIQKRLGDRVDTSSQANEIANQFGRNTAQAAPQNQSVAERSDASQSVSQAPVQNTRTANGGMGEIMSKVAALEADKNLDAAIQILRGAVQVDLKNADLHHRLAVDLLANGQISEAISEFRMSSALRPENQDYAADLARAMQIHKTALQSTSGVATTAEVAK
jgi:tetratricopeptide (TPR) repeat protein